MLDLIWNFFQQGKLIEHDFKTKMHDAKLKSQSHKQTYIEARVRELEKRHEQLKLVTLALWSLLRDHSGLKESELREYVDEIDLLDGRRDGKADLGKEKILCDGCDRTVLTTSVACPYCGTPNKMGNPFTGA